MARKPVRLRLLRHLADRGPSALEELADAADVHPNTVRSHVEALEKEGVLEREERRTGRRGRPVARFRLRPGWRTHAGGLDGLARLMGETLASLDGGAEVLARAGERWGARHDRLVDALEELGYGARRDGDDVILAACPCPLVAPDQPLAICSVTHAVAEGAGARVAAADHDPQRRRCRLRLAG